MVKESWDYARCVLCGERGLCTVTRVYRGEDSVRTFVCKDCLSKPRDESKKET